jgi:hypothetical protein
MHMKRRSTLITLAALSALALLAARAQAQTRYTLVDSKVSMTVGSGVNDQAHVVGWAIQPDRSYRPFYWTGSPSSPLALLPPFSGAPDMHGAALGINNSDTVVGYEAVGSPVPYGSDQHGFVWHPGDASLTDLNSVEDVLTTQGWEIEYASRINDSGVILAGGQQFLGYDANGAPIIQGASLLLTPSTTNPGHYLGAYYISDPGAPGHSGNPDLASNGYALLGNPGEFFDGSTLSPIPGVGLTIKGLNASAEIVGGISHKTGNILRPNA